MLSRPTRASRQEGHREVNGTLKRTFLAKKKVSKSAGKIRTWPSHIRLQSGKAIGQCLQLTSLQGCHLTGFRLARPVFCMMLVADSTLKTGRYLPVFNVKSFPATCKAIRARICPRLVPVERAAEQDLCYPSLVSNHEPLAC